MFCDNCGAELAEGARFCSKCGKEFKTRNKNIYIALVLTFILTGLGSIYAGNTKKGLILLAIRILFSVLGVFLNIFYFLVIMVWAYGFYETYRDVEIANGHSNPKLINDFGNWNQNRQIIAIIIIGIISMLTIAGCVSLLTVNTYLDSGSTSHYYSSGSSSGESSGSSGSSHSSHYGGVDDSPWTIAKNDPDWYYDHYDYGDNDEIDEYLESEGYD